MQKNRAIYPSSLHYQVMLLGFKARSSESRTGLQPLCTYQAHLPHTHPPYLLKGDPQKVFMDSPAFLATSFTELHFSILPSFKNKVLLCQDCHLTLPSSWDYRSTNSARLLGWSGDLSKPPCTWPQATEQQRLIIPRHHAGLLNYTKSFNKRQQKNPIQLALQ